MTTCYTYVPVEGFAGYPPIVSFPVVGDDLVNNPVAMAFGQIVREPVQAGDSYEMLPVWHVYPQYSGYYTEELVYGVNPEGGAVYTRTGIFRIGQWYADMSANNAKIVAQTYTMEGWECTPQKMFVQTLAKALRMTPADFGMFQMDVLPRYGQIKNPAVMDRILSYELVAAKGIGDNPQVQKLLAEMEPRWQSAGDAWADQYFAMQKGPGLMTFISAIGFVMLPLAIGTALTGAAAAAAAAETSGALALEAPTEAAWLSEVAGETSQLTATALELPSLSQAYDVVKTIRTIEGTLFAEEPSAPTSAVRMVSAPGSTPVTSAPVPAPTAAAIRTVAPTPTSAATAQAIMPSAAPEPSSFLTTAGRLIDAAQAVLTPEGDYIDSLTGEPLVPLDGGASAGFSWAPFALGAGLLLLLMRRKKRAS